MRTEPETPEQRFAAFRRGDRQALGDVFDRCAPELLRVAAHASGSIGLAEDAVQATFVAAIEHAERWDPARPLLPWLIGILGNQLRSLRTAAQRPVDPTRVRTAADAPPDLAAIAAEFDAELSRALDQLPAAYRTPLVLHLRHGLSAAEIAHAQGQPASTVRSQLARGLDRLRTYLPAGLASALALTLTPSRGLAAIKAAALAHAPAAAAPVLTTAILMQGSKLASVFAAIALLALGLWFAAPWETQGQGATIEIQNADPRQPEVAANVARDESAPAQREAAAATSTPVAGDALASVLGRLRDDRGAPLAAARIVALLDGTAETRDASELPSCTTGTDGQFELRGLAAGEWRLHSESPAAAPAERRVQLAAGQQLTGVELVAPRGQELTGRVVDDRGQPVAGASVCLRQTRELGPGIVQRLNPPGAMTQSGADGTFRLGGRLDGPSELFASAPQHLAAAIAVSGPSQEVRLPRAASIEVAVVDPDDAPVVGARVWLGSVEPADLAPHDAVDTDAHGNATLSDQLAGPRRLFVTSAKHPAHSEVVELRAGEISEHVVRVGAGGRVHVRVFGPDQRPVAGAGVELRASPAGRSAGAMKFLDEAGVTVSAMRPGLRHATTDATGRATLIGVPAGQFEVDASASELCGARPVAIECLAQGELRIDVHVQPTAKLTVRTFGPTGMPRAQASLRLRCATEHYDLAVDLTTDDAGQLLVSGLAPGACTATLLTGGAGAGTASEIATSAVQVQLLSGQTLSIDLREPARATYTAQVRDAAGGVAGALVTLAPEGQAGPTTRHYADADGHVTIGNLIPGTHVGKFARSAAHPAMPLRVEVSEVGARGPSVLSLPGGSLRLTLRGPRGPVVDALVVAPERAVFTGRQMTISPDGKGGVTVTDLRPDGARSDAFGVAVLTDLPAGEHTVQVEHDDFAPASFTIEIGAGAVSHALELAPAGRALVRVRNAQGQPCLRAWLEVDALRAEGTDQARAGRNPVTGGWRQVVQQPVLHGERTLAGLPPGRYRAAAAPQPITRVGEAVEFEVRAGERTEVTVVLPD